MDMCRTFKLKKLMIALVALSTACVPTTTSVPSHSAFSTTQPAPLQPKEAITPASALVGVMTPLPEPASTSTLVPTLSTPVPTRTPLPAETAVVPTAPPEVFLSELAPVAASVGYGDFTVGVYPSAPQDMNRSGPLFAHNTIYRNGLWAHAPSRLEYSLNGQYGKLKMQILMQEDVSCGDGTVFRVLADGKETYKSNRFTASTIPLKVSVAITGVNILELIVDKLDGGDCDWAIWGDPVLTSADAATLARLATITPTPNPDLPCGGVMPDRVYFFLDCNDIRRIRRELASDNAEAKRAWGDLRSVVDDYRSNFPTTYDPADTSGALWWGSGNYVARDMALIYLITGDRAYARDIVRLLDLVKRNTPYRNHLGPHSFDFQGLLSKPSYGEVVYQSLLFAYQTIQGSGLLTAKQQQEYESRFMHQALLLEEFVQLGGEIPLSSHLNRNIRVAANTASASIALAFPNHPASRGLYQRARLRLDRQVKNWWEPDGGWGENTDSYGYRALEGLLILAETLRKNTGEDLYADDIGGKTLHALCAYYVKVLTPEGTSPAFNESNFLFVDPGLLQLCADRTADETLVFAAQDYLRGYYSTYGYCCWTYTLFHMVAWADSARSEAGTPPDYSSVLLPDTGVAVLRSGWEPQAQYLLVQFTASRVHHEFSYGTIYLYDRGPWLVGNGYHIPDDMPTDQHSTLSLDHSNQTYTSGTVLAFADIGQTAMASVTSRSYPNLQHTRTILWAKPWHHWIVVDDATLISSAGAHTLQLRWYVKGFHVRREDNLWKFRGGYNDRRFAIDMFTSTAAEYSPISRSDNAVGVEMEVDFKVSPLRLVTSLTSFLQYDELPEVTRTDYQQGTTIKSQLNGETWIWLLPIASAKEGQIGDSFVAGRAGCVRITEAGVQGYCLFSGKTLQHKGDTLVKAEKDLSVDVDLAEGKIYVDSPIATNLALRWPQPVSTIVDEAGMPVTFTTDNRMILFDIKEGQSVFSVK